MSKLEEDSYIVDLYYSGAVSEIKNGLSKEVLQETLEHLEENEMYLACAGVKKALDWYDVYAFTFRMIELDEYNKDDEINLNK
tara:strand:+ start:3250 stop:3498 length:249 start_codon:yes stop_codon:yes gene_type:complete